VYAAENSVFMPLEKAAISMRKGPYKLIAYYGYPGFDDAYEFYNLEEDPEELYDVAQRESQTFSRLKHELLDALAEANHPYENK
jgi:hypothetical protein